MIKDAQCWKLAASAWEKKAARTTLIEATESFMILVVEILDSKGFLFEQSPKSTRIYTILRDKNITALLPSPWCLKCWASINTTVYFSFCWSMIEYAPFHCGHQATGRRPHVRMSVHSATYCAYNNIRPPLCEARVATHFTDATMWWHWPQ